VIALKFPPINEVLRWRDIFPTFNKIALIAVLAVVITTLVFWLANRKDPLKAPTGVRNFAEVTVEFIENGVVMQTMGKQGLKWTPFLLTLFCFIYLCNLPGILPIFQMPATARMGIPMFLALLVWVVFHGAGIKSQGVGPYFKNMVIPPGVPMALLPIVALIEFVSTVLVRPFSLAVRLFANMLAGHILLVTFAVLTHELATADAIPLIPVAALPLAMLTFLTGFEVLVAFLQAYIFVILTAVYIGGAEHPEH
jgi:F-type H+-transporting ATPase subunit a